MRKNSISLYVRYAEVDKMGFVYYGAYSPWLIEACKPFSRGAKHPRSMDISYQHSAFYDELITIEAMEEKEFLQVTAFRDTETLCTARISYDLGVTHAPDTMEVDRGTKNVVSISVRAHETQTWGIPAITAFTWFETARNAHTRAVGLPYSECEARGKWLPVVRAWYQMEKAPCSDDVLIESTAIRSGIKCGFINRILDRDGTVLGSGGTLHVFMTPEGKVIRPWSELTERLMAKSTD